MCFDIENLNFQIKPQDQAIANLEAKFKRIIFLLKLQTFHLMIHMYI